MHLHLLYRLERIADLAPVLTATDTVILMNETLVDDLLRSAGALPCAIKVLSGNSSRSELSVTFEELTDLVQIHRHCVTWD